MTDKYIILIHHFFKGGFAAAHAFLWREGPQIGLPPSYVLVDYDPLVSLFAQLEASHQEQEEYKNAPAREKTARTLQKIIDNSMTKLTLEEQRLNNLASDLARPENVDKMKQSMRTLTQKVSTKGISFGRQVYDVLLECVPTQFILTITLSCPFQTGHLPYSCQRNFLRRSPQYQQKFHQHKKNHQS